MEENRVTEKVYCYDHPSAYNHDNSAMLAALLNKNDNPLEAAALMNGGMGGQWNNPFIYLVWMMFAQRMWGNGWDNNGQNAQNVELQNQIQSLRSQISDNYRLLEERYPNSSKDEKTKIIIEDAINYLNDEDNPFGSEKIWGYLNAKL